MTIYSQGYISSVLNNMIHDGDTHFCTHCNKNFKYEPAIYEAHANGVCVTPDFQRLMKNN